MKVKLNQKVIVNIYDVETEGIIIAIDPKSLYPYTVQWIQTNSFSRKEIKIVH